MRDLLLVLLGGAAGTWLRWAAGLRWGRAGTFLVNVAGSGALGALVALAAGQTSEAVDDAVLLLGVGGCGAFTTFSTLGWEVALLARRGQRGAALRYLTASAVAGTGAAAAGWALAAAAAGVS